MQPRDLGRWLSIALFALFASLGCRAPASTEPGASPAAGAGAAPDGGGAAAPAPGGGAGHAASGAAGAGARPDAGSSSAAGGQDGAVASSPDAEVGTRADGGGTGAGSDAGAGPSPGPFPPVSDFAGDGPYTATTMDNVGPSSNYTVYVPTELAPNGAKNPIVGWMSGGSTAPSFYDLLPHLATHGFVVVASNTVPGIGDEVALGQEIIDGIDWAIAENARADSPLFDKLDTTKIASVGYSMGSLATFTIASDPRLTTTVHISGGNMDPTRIDNLRAPAAFICGIPGDDSCNILSTDCDIAAANCDTDFANATTSVFYANFSYGHLGILTSPYAEQIGAMTTAWLRYQLMGDTTLKAMFVGDSCTYCSDSAWKVQQKNL